MGEGKHIRSMDERELVSSPPISTTLVHHQPSQCIKLIQLHLEKESVLSVT